MIYENVFRELQKKRVKYLVIGGVAVNFYGILRATADLDLMVHLEDVPNVSRFVSALKKLGFKPRVPVRIEDFKDKKKRQTWIKEKHAKVFTFVSPKSFEQIDVALMNPIDFKKAFKDRTVFDIGSTTVSVSSLKDLKRMKRMAGREKDLSDIRHMEKIERDRDA